MRLVYLCVADPPPPNSDFTVVNEFFDTLPNHLRPRTRTHDSKHTCFFANVVGTQWLPELHDFAIAFVSSNFLDCPKAMQCLSRAQTAFPNMICVDLYGDLDNEQRKLITGFSKHFLTLDECRDFLLNVFPQIASAYDMEENALIESIESDGYSYLDNTITNLQHREKQHRITSWICYALSFIFLVAILAFAYIRFRTCIQTELILYSIPKTIILCIELVVLSILSVSVARFLFLLGKSFMVESIRFADRAHAIGLGKLYLQLYKNRFDWNELKDVLKNWNIDTGSAFINLDARDIEPINLDQLATIFHKKN